MFKLPKLHVVSSPQRIEQVAFKGLNKKENADGSYFNSCSCMESKEFPFVSSRNRRSVFKVHDGMKILGVGYSKEFYYVLNDGEKSYFYYGGELKGSWPDEIGVKKSFAEVGKRICIFPDGAYYRPKDERLIEEYLASHPEIDGKIYSNYARLYTTDGGGGKYANTNRLEYSRSVKWVHEDGDVSSEVILKDGDYIKLHSLAPDGGIVSFCGLPNDVGIKMSGSSTFSDYIMYKEASFSSTYYQGWSASSYDSGFFALVRFKYTYPCEYDEEFFFDNSNKIITSIHRFDGCDYFIFGAAPDGAGTAYNWRKSFFEGNIDSGAVIEFQCSDADIGEFIPASAKIEEVGVREFYASSHAYYAAYLKFPENTFTKTIDGTWGKGSNYFGASEKHFFIVDSGVTLKTISPGLSNVCACNNRLWGFSGNTIHASALGRPFIFNDFSGNVADSYSVELNIDRDIIACTCYSGIPIFFTQDRIIKVYGNTPATFSTVETLCSGISVGGKNSIALCQGVLYFLDSDGNLVSYDGTYPRTISFDLNNTFKKCISAADSRFVYFFTDKDIFTFDTFFGCWMCEEEKSVNFACEHNDGVIFASGSTIEMPLNNELVLGGFNSFIEPDIKSYVEFPVIDEGYFGRKTLNSLQLKIKADKGTSLCVSLKENDSGVWHEIYSCRAEKGTEVYNIPIKPGRCLSFAIKIDAVGYWQFEGYSKLITAGSYKK